MSANATQSCHHQCQFFYFLRLSPLEPHTKTSLSLYVVYSEIVKGLTGSAVAGLLALFISPAGQIMPQIQVLSLMNREAAAAHWPFILGHVFTWAQNMPGQDNCCHFGGRLKPFCQLPAARVVKIKSVIVLMCLCASARDHKSYMYTQYYFVCLLMLCWKYMRVPRSTCVFVS